jgi:membrane-associated phospholipid phosphatase
VWDNYPKGCAAQPHYRTAPVFSSADMKPKSKAALPLELGRRMVAQLWLKSLGVPGFMTLFFLGYFLILNFSWFQVTIMPLTAIDRAIPYHNSAWPLYVSLWVYVQIPPSWIDNRRELIRYGWAAAAVSLIGFAFFIFWPTMVPAIGGAEAGSSFAGIRRIDTTGNSCPSLHVAFAVFTALWIGRFLRRAGVGVWLRFSNLCWCLGIVYSTLGTKQHVLLDAIAGAVLGFAGAAMLFRVEARRRESAVASDLAQISPAARKL